MPEIADTQFDIRPGEDPYARLEIERTADDEAVRKAYFQQVRRFPPEQAPQEFQQIRRAYEQLRTPERRKMTDLFLLQPLPPQPNRRMPACDLSVWTFSARSSNAGLLLPSEWAPAPSPAGPAGSPRA